MFSEFLQELSGYREFRSGEAVSERWVSLCAGLRDYQAPSRSLAIKKARKWELVSAFQKSIRRGDKQIALRLISAMDGMPTEYAYFWRRLCVIACEDIGPADDTLAAFVVVCSTVFLPKKTGAKNYDLLCFLAEQMCDLSTRSRIYCSYSIIEAAAVKSELPALGTEDELIVSAILHQRATVQAPKNPRQRWQKKNDWRTQGLLKFVGLRLSLEMTTVKTAIPPHKLLFDLPSYCYDMHTRTGLAMLRWLVHGVRGAEEIRELFRENRVESPHKVLGEALFFVEGGRIQSELIYGPLCHLEQQFFAHKSGLSLRTWLQLQILVERAVVDGVIDRVREDVLDQRYGSLFAIDCGGMPDF
jgi:hypothetical protein